MPKYLEEAANHSPFVLVIGEQDVPIRFLLLWMGKGWSRSTFWRLLMFVSNSFTFWIFIIHGSAITWEFLQKVVYGIDDQVKGKTSPAVIAMRAGLK